MTLLTPMWCVRLQGSGGTNALALTVSRLGRRGGDKDGALLFSRVLSMSAPPSFGASLNRATRLVEGYAASACPSAQKGGLGVEAVSCLRSLPVQEVMTALSGAASDDYDLPKKVRCDLDLDLDQSRCMLAFSPPPAPLSPLTLAQTQDARLPGCALSHFSSIHPWEITLEHL